MADFKLGDINGNPSDPLKKNGPDSGQALFQRLSHSCNQFSYDDVVAAASNLLLNAIRQKCATSKQAVACYEELCAAMKATLLGQHYTLAGTRRSVFAFHQTLEPGTFDARNKRRH